MPPIVPLPKRVTSRKHARKITTAYHAITEQLHHARDESEHARLQVELAEMGGVQAYQQASALNTALHSTSRWVISSLRTCGILAPGRGAPRPRVLEVGAINTQLLDCAALHVRAIDLHSSEPRIEQCDFLSLPHGGEIEPSSGASVPYDAVVCSMVLNCVPDPRRRFDMLIGLRAQLRAGGRCFVTVPRTCLLHSFTIDEELFRTCLVAVGLPTVADGPKPRGTPGADPASAPRQKISYFECVAALPSAEAAQRFQRGRHERRRALSSRGATRRKSRGADFDVDLGGYLGFGARVPRSFEVDSASKREQAAAQAHFQRQCADEDATAVADAVASGVSGAACATAAARQGRGQLLSLQQLATLRQTGGGDDDDGGDGSLGGGEDDGSGGEEVARSRGPESLEATSEWKLIAEAAARLPPERLEFSRWRWYDPDEARRLKDGGPTGWIFVPPAAQFPPGSSYDTSGWEWTDDGWEWRRPSASSQAAKRELAAPAFLGGGHIDAQPSGQRGELVVGRERRAASGGGGGVKKEPRGRWGGASVHMGRFARRLWWRRLLSRNGSRICSYF